jgi:hypothetical protein
VLLLSYRKSKVKLDNFILGGIIIPTCTHLFLVGTSTEEEQSGNKFQKNFMLEKENAKCSSPYDRRHSEPSDPSGTILSEEASIARSFVLCIANSRVQGSLYSYI